VTLPALLQIPSSDDIWRLDTSKSQASAALSLELLAFYMDNSLNKRLSTWFAALSTTKEEYHVQ
jgi:hypothetical protein